MKKKVIITVSCILFVAASVVVYILTDHIRFERNVILRLYIQLGASCEHYDVALTNNGILKTSKVRFRLHEDKFSHRLEWGGTSARRRLSEAEMERLLGVADEFYESEGFGMLIQASGTMVMLQYKDKFYSLYGFLLSKGFYEERFKSDFERKFFRQFRVIDCEEECEASFWERFEAHYEAYFYERLNAHIDAYFEAYLEEIYPVAFVKLVEALIALSPLPIDWSPER
jgi:hypothetical protein